jgi:hypothetical protein
MFIFVLRERSGLYATLKKKKKTTTFKRLLKAIILND